MNKRAMQGLVTGMLVFSAGATMCQDLAELAGREKARRAGREATGVRIRIEHMPADAPSEKAGDRRTIQHPTSSSPKGISSSVSSAEVKEKQTRRMYLSRRGPALRQEIATQIALREQCEREMADVERRYPPTLRRGLTVEDARLTNLRKELGKSRQHLFLLEQEWRRMEEEVRRNGWPPGLLRGQDP